MSADMLSRIRDVLPSYDSLPDLLDPPRVSEITGLKTGTLASDRCSADRAGRLGIGFVRSGRLIRYPKTEIAKFLLRGAVGITAAE